MKSQSKAIKPIKKTQVSVQEIIRTHIYYRRDAFETDEASQLFEQKQLLVNNYCVLNAYITVISTTTEIVSPLIKSGERKELMELVDKLKVGVGDSLLVANIGEFGRGMVDVVTFLSSGVKFIAVEDKIDTTKEGGMMAMSYLSSFVKLESSLKSDRVKGAMSLRKEKGLLCGRIPFGKRVKEGFLIDNEDQLETIRMVQKMRTTGSTKKTYKEISKELIKLKRLNWKGEVGWSSSTVGALLLRLESKP